MAQEQAPDLASALAAAGRAVAPPRMPRADLRIRAKTSPALRRLLPTRLVVGRAIASGRARWESNVNERQEALRAIEAIVGGTARAGEVSELARRRLIEEEVDRALFWQPWKDPSIDASSTANLQTALSADRGVLVSSCHLGPMFLHVSAITSRGVILYAVAAPWFFQKPSADYWGRRIARWWKEVQKRNERLIGSVGAFPVLQALLERGETVLLYFDLPGSRETRFLGKTVMLASGSARLAAATDALVLPIRARRSGHRVWADIGAPLDPRDFESSEELHDALAGVHERWILEQPATLEDPNRAGAWERAATAEAWMRPQPAPGPSSEPALSIQRSG